MTSRGDNMFPKMKRWESKKYLDWIKTQTCAKCSLPAEPHHLKGIGHMSGLGVKAPDWAAMPLCHFHHDEMHASPELWPDQWEIIARTLGRAIDEGVFKLK